MAEDAPPAMEALPAPHVDIDALPYVDSQYTNPAIKSQVDALIASELKTFAPKDYLEHLPPMHEPNFDAHPLLQAEWMRVCEQQPMSKMDTSRRPIPQPRELPRVALASPLVPQPPQRAGAPTPRRYQLDPPPAARQMEPKAWQRAVDNAQAQLEHQSNRLVNLELLQKHGANLWRLNLQGLEAASARLEREQSAVGAEIEALNRKRKAEQTEVGPKLARLEAEWVAAVKKNMQIEAATQRLEVENAAARRALDPTSQ